MSRFLALTAILFASPAVAQVADAEAKACERKGAKIERADEARDLREEAERFRGNGQNVVRQGDRLV